MLTDKQQKVLDTIINFFSKYGKSPTIEELQILLNQKSKRGVVQYLQALEKKGFITRESHYRGIKLGNAIGFQTMLMIPFLGYANAGKPIAYADGNFIDNIPVSKNLISGDSSNYFFLKIEGTSMNDCKVKDKYIENGSYVLIDKSDIDISKKAPFLFIIDGVATVKIPKIENENLYLLPKSRDTIHKPIILSSSDNFNVNGRVVDVFNFDN